MSYQKINFVDFPNTSTPLNANNLNHMDDQIEFLTDREEILRDRVAELGSDMGQAQRDIERLQSEIPETQVFNVGVPKLIGTLKKGNATFTMYRKYFSETQTNSSANKSFFIPFTDSSILDPEFQQPTVQFLLGINGIIGFGDPGIKKVPIGSEDGGRSVNACYDLDQYSVRIDVTNAPNPCTVMGYIDYIVG